MSDGGLDVVKVGRWLAEHCGAAPPITVSPISGGRSNLTSVVIDARGQRFVVRRPPLSGVLASAHDVAREGRIMAALAATDVPVPEVLGIEEDPSITGAPFLVTAFVDGEVVRDRATATALNTIERAQLGPAVAHTLAAIHAVDIDAAGLGSLARRDGYLARQVARWTRQLASGSDRPLAVLDALARDLAAAIPPQVGVALVHGDFRLDNLIVDPSSGTVSAVLDWELATLGDPLADVGTLLAYWGVPATQHGAASVLLDDLPTGLSGFSAPRELVAAYAVATDQGVDELAERLRPYLAFAWFRIACILEGVRIRTAAGAYGAGGGERHAELELLADLVPRIGERALAVLGRRGPLGFDHELT